MAAPVFVAASAIGNSTAGSFSIVLPAHTTNDILWVISWYRASATVATPAGWTQAATALRGTTRYYLHWIRAVDANTADPLFDYTGADDGFGICDVYNGVRTTGNPYDVLGAFASGTANPATLTGITTLTANSLVVASIGGEDNTGTGATMTATDPSAFVEHYAESATGTDGCVAIGEGERATAGATGNVSCDFGATVVGWGGWVAALVPVVSNPVTVTPGTLSLVLATFAAVVTATANVTVTPSTKALSLSTFAPTVTASDHKIVTPGAAALALQTFAPTVTVGTPNVTVTPGTLALTTATFAPTVTATANQTVVPGTIALSFTTFAPTVTASDHKTVTPDTAALTLTTFAPDVTVAGAASLIEEESGHGWFYKGKRGQLPKYYRDLKIEDYRSVQLPADEKANAVAIQVLDKIAEIWQQLEDDDKHFAAMLAQVDQIERQVATFIESRQIYRLVALVETRIRIEQQAAQAIADAKRKDEEEGEEFMHLFS